MERGTGTVPCDQSVPAKTRWGVAAMIDFEQTYDVLVVGGGPVGFGLALELGQRGHSVAIVERTATLHNIPPVSYTHLTLPTNREV